MRRILLLLCTLILLCTIVSNTIVTARETKPSRHLPLIESRTPGNSDYYVIFFTGNGGWRDLARSVTHYLNSKNLSVLVINTKKYLLLGKKPERIACDIENLIDRYSSRWNKENVLLLGYSMGAEIIPFAVNCMDDRYVHKLNDLVLIGPWQKATFRTRLSDYVVEINRGADIYTQLVKMNRVYVICDDNKYSICHKDLHGAIDHDFLGGGHHFGKDYATLTKLIGKRLKLDY
jgi:type IV secretory pathway VirJ component